MRDCFFGFICVRTWALAKIGDQQYFISACINCLNKLSVAVGASRAIKRAIKAGKSISSVNVALRLKIRVAEIFTLDKIELLEWEDLFKP